MNLLTKEAQTQWATIAPILTIRNEREYDRRTNDLPRLIQLTDRRGMRNGMPSKVS
jgi:hypothetical protein